MKKEQSSYLLFKALTALLILLFAGCVKKEVGYISGSMYYTENPMYVARGVVKVTASLESDGSTNPLSVKIASIINVADGKSADSDFLAKSKTLLYNGIIDYQDTTLQQLNAKLKDTVYAPLTINELGGRLQFSPQTTNIPGNGPFALNLEVSNVRGTQSIKNATMIYLRPLIPDTLFTGAYAGYASDDGTSVALLADPVISISYVPDTTRKVVFKFYDSRGVIYDPKKNGISNRNGRVSFKNYDPYYPETITDTSIEYLYPLVPGQFPAFPIPDNNSLGLIVRGTYGIFYAIPGYQIANNPNPSLSLYVFTDQAFYLPGTHIINIRFTDIQWK